MLSKQKTLFPQDLSNTYRGQQCTSGQSCPHPNYSLEQLTLPTLNTSHFSLYSFVVVVLLILILLFQAVKPEKTAPGKFASQLKVAIIYWVIACFTVFAVHLSFTCILLCDIVYITVTLKVKM